MKETPGQERAYQVIEFGFNNRQRGFNLYAMGSSGSGKYAAIKAFLNNKASVIM
jgi:DNA replication protein DnaC